MINNAVAGEGLSVFVNNGYTPYFNTNNSLPMTGSVSYDSNSKTFKVFDGMTWHQLGTGSLSINFTPNTLAVLKWAEQKMFEELELKTLCEQHPTLKDIVDQMNNDMASYKNKIAMITALIKKEETIGTN